MAPSARLRSDSKTNALSPTACMFHLENHWTNSDTILYERYAIAEQPILIHSNLLQPHTQIPAVDNHMADERGGSDKTPITVS